MGVFIIMDIIIERARSNDASSLLKYFKQIGKESDNLSFGKEGLPFTVEDETNYISNIENSTDDILIVAKHNNIIIGTASLSRLPRRMSHRGEFSVSVMKKYWNKGIGSKLTSEIIKFAKSNFFEIIELQVRSDNDVAIYMYEKFGFKKFGTHPAFFKINNQEISFDYMYLSI